MSSNPQIKPEDDQIYDILNLSPNSGIKQSQPTFGSLNGYEYSDSPPPAPTSNDMHSLPDIRNHNMPQNMSQNMSHNLHPNQGPNQGGLLTPNYHRNSSQSSYLSADSISRSLNPSSPGNQSTHSLYSDYSNPASPYFDAVSNVSHHGNSPNISPVNETNPVALTSGPDYLDLNFDNAIELGGSVSSANLAAMGDQSRNKNLMYPQPQSHQYNDHMYKPQEMDSSQYDQIAELVQMQLSHLDQNPSFNISESNGNQQNMQPFPGKPKNDFFYDSHQIDEINKMNSYNPPRIVQPDEDSHTKNGESIVRNRTPSLFSNSSRSSMNEDGNENSQDLGNLLTPDEIQTIKRGRKKSFTGSRSRSRSGSRSVHEDEEQPENVISTREKMLELASPNQISKRTQKHPSAHACHLCDKRFTRPYNLKSHLRTHTDERPFICSICGKAFARQHDRKRHEDLHSGEKRFQCKGNLKDGTPYGCGRRFARADALRRHFQTEAGKLCIKNLIEEEDKDRDPGSNTSGETSYLSPNMTVPHLAISPPEP